MQLLKREWAHQDYLKVMLKINKLPMIELLVDRLKQSKEIRK